MHPCRRDNQAIRWIAQNRRQLWRLPSYLDGQRKDFQSRAGFQHFKNGIHAIYEFGQTTVGELGHFQKADGTDTHRFASPIRIPK